MSMAKHGAQRVENLEVIVAGVQDDMGFLREQKQLISEKFERFLKIQEENTHSHSPSVTGKAQEALGLTAGIIEGLSPNFPAHHDQRLRRIEIPMFDGENPDGWILKAGRYFHLYHMSNEEKLEAAIIEGDALL